jgi:hypothetical protein
MIIDDNNSFFLSICEVDAIPFGEKHFTELALDFDLLLYSRQ